MEKQNLKKLVGKPVRYEWVDPSGFVGWRHPKDLTDDPESVVSYGFLVKLGRSSAHFASDRATNGQFNMNSSLPYGVIVGVRRVK